mgnify:CR=1 FL=1
MPETIEVFINGIRYIPADKAENKCEMSHPPPIAVGDFVRVVNVLRPSYVIPSSAVGECGKVLRHGSVYRQLVVELPNVPNSFNHQWYFEPEDLELVEE